MSLGRPDALDRSAFTVGCGMLYDGTGRPPRTNVTLAVDEGRVAAVAEGTERADIDFSDHSVTPGLVDAHAHPCFGSAGNAGWERVANDVLARFAWGARAAQEALAAGVTTQVDVGSADAVAIDVAAAIRRGHLLGPRLLAAGGALTVTGGHGTEIGVIADDARELITGVRNAVQAGADIIKIMATGGAIDPQSNRRRAQYSTKELLAAVDEAHRLRRLVVAHANATEGVTRSVAAGVDIIAHCNWLAPDPDVVTIDWDTVEQMASRGTTIDLNLGGALRDLGRSDGEVSNWPRELPQPRTRWELLEPVRERGVPIYLTSDGFGPASAEFPVLLAQFHAQYPIPVERLIAMATSVPATALGEDGIGSLTPGSPADFVVLPGDLSSDITALTRPSAVYQHGSEVARRRWLRMPHSGEVGDAAASQAELLARALP